MTKEKLEARLAELQTLLEQTLSNANALQGAIQDTRFWLAELEKEQPDIPKP